jgi:hypothetical protein
MSEKKPVLPFTTEREMYGRHITYSAGHAECDLCGRPTHCLIIDTSEGEYLAANVCPACATAAAIPDKPGTG